MAIVACTVAEAGGAKNAQLKDFMAEQFIGDGPRRPKQSVEHMARVFSNYARMHNAYQAQVRKRQSNGQ